MPSPSYSPVELARLALALPELREAERRLRAAAAARGITYVVPAYGGVRTPEEQAQLEKWRDESDLKADGKLGADTAGWYPVAPPEKGLHPVGAAFDVEIQENGKKVSPGDSRYKQLADLAPSVGLRAGYYFQRRDQFHFELPLTRDIAEARWKATVAARLTAGGGAVVAIALVAGLMYLNLPGRAS